MATRFWVRTNDSSNAELNRSLHVKENGGEFIKCHRTGWKWVAPSDAPAPKKSVAKRSAPKKSAPKKPEKLSKIYKTEE